MLKQNAYYRLGPNKQVFIDWEFIEPGYGIDGRWAVKLRDQKPQSWEMPYGIKLSVHNPSVDLKPLVSRDKPWESTITNHTSVFEDEGVFRMFYQCRDDIRLSDRRQAEAVPSDNATKAILAYAESSDGINWVKPEIGTVSFDGSTKNNIVYGLNVSKGQPVASPMVFKDPNASSSEQYKLVYRGVHKDQPSIFGAISSDGLHWKALEDPLLANYVTDTQNIIGFNQDKGLYTGYFRGWTAFESGALHGRRTIAYAETDDFKHWPTPETIVSADLHDSPDTDIYTNSYTVWPEANAHLMFPAFYERTSDVRFVHIMTSRDGLHWNRPIRQPIIPSGEPNSDMEGTLSAGAGLLNIHPGKVSLPVVPRAETHNQVFYPSGPATVGHWGFVCLATWRQDGFMSLEADAEGYCATIPFVFEGNKLELNSWTRFGGEIHVEVTDATTEFSGANPEDVKGFLKPISGRTFKDCDPISGDNFGGIVTWNGESDLSQWAGKPIRLRLSIRRARIYAIRFI